MQGFKCERALIVAWILDTTWEYKSDLNGMNIIETAIEMDKKW